MASDQMVIRLYFDSNICITTEEYEEMVHELQVKQIAGTITKGDAILAHVLHSVGHRYHEIISRRAWNAHRDECEKRQANGHGHCLHTTEDHRALGWDCDYWPVGGPCCGKTARSGAEREKGQG